VSHHVRELIEQREAEWLSAYAARASESAGRITPEEPDPVRTCYQRDRDRVLHSKAFRRLKHKTQVFLDPVGDHYRTRMTHSLEVAQIARTIGRALRLNEDLIEAIALAHDVGHTPFGHAGEEALDEAIKATDDLEITGFRHYEQSLRVVDVIEKLNLSQETRAGIGGHSKGRKDLTAFDGEPTSTLEAAVVRVSDRIAYLNHDLDDALRSGIVSHIPTQYDSLGATHSLRIGGMVQDVILRSQDRPAIVISKPLLETMNELKEWLFENVYLQYPKRYPESDKAKNVVRELFIHYSQPFSLPAGFDGVQGAVDYVAGMTDRFAIEDFTRLKIPGGFRP
jgi:dGTPase